jgi:electron transport complex protein RnfE
MAEKGYGTLVGEGLWTNNQALVAMLGLCPLLATTTTATNGLGMGLATTTVLVLSNATISLIRNLVRPEVRLPVFVLVIASFVTAVELTMQAQFYELYLVLGLFIPLIVTNCAIIGRAEAYASKARLDKAILDGLAMGVGFTLVLMVLGGMRELLGQGTLFYQAHLLLGAGAQGFGLDLGDGFQGALLAILPPGAFIGLGFLIALKNLIDKRVERRHAARRAPNPKHIEKPAAGDAAPASG